MTLIPKNLPSIQQTTQTEATPNTKAPQSTPTTAPARTTPPPTDRMSAPTVSAPFVSANSTQPVMTPPTRAGRALGTTTPSATTGPIGKPPAMPADASALGALSDSPSRADRTTSTRQAIAATTDDRAESAAIALRGPTDRARGEVTAYRIMVAMDGADPSMQQVARDFVTQVIDVAARHLATDPTEKFTN